MLMIEISFPDGNVTRSGRIGFILGVWLPLDYNNIIVIKLHTAFRDQNAESHTYKRTYMYGTCTPTVMAVCFSVPGGLFLR